MSIINFCVTLNVDTKGAFGKRKSYGKNDYDNPNVIINMFRGRFITGSVMIMCLGEGLY